MLKRTAQFTLAGLVSLSLANTGLAQPLESEEERVGYSLGVILGRQLQSDISQLNIPSFTQALEDVYANKELKLQDADIEEVLQSLQQKIMAEAQAEANKQAEENLAKGTEFLAANAKQKNIKTTESGLQYQIIKQGTGKKPTAESRVKVHYEGRLINDEIFDSSYQRGEPVVFQTNQVIAGWQEGLQLMQAGGEFMFYIPADLAYGPAGAGGAIGPNETLVFKVELLEVDPKE